MKKIFAVILVILSVLGITGTVCAEDTGETPQQIGDFFFKYEKVENYKYQLLYSRDGENYENVDVPLFSRGGGFPAHGNGRYILADIYPSNSIIMSMGYAANESNAPLYVFDENLNLIALEEFGGYLQKYTYQDGQFNLHFFYKEIPSLGRSSSHGHCNVTYETFDGIDWRFVSIDGVANIFDFEGQNLIEIVDKPENLYWNEKNGLKKVGSFYLTGSSFSKDGVEFTSLISDTGNAINLNDGGYGGGLYFGFASSDDGYIMYQYDSDMNLIKTKKWEGDPRGTFVYYKGVFYLCDYVKNPSAQNVTDKKYYRSSDGVTWESINETEYGIARNTEILLNGSEWYKSRDGGKLNEYMDGTPVLRESHLYAPQGPVFQQKSVMRDGFKKIYLPLNANLMTGIRTDENYMYVKIDVLDSKCYRIPLSAFESEAKVMYDGKLLAFDVAPVIENGRTLIPLRFLFEQMGAKVNWDETSQSATVEHKGKTIVFSIDNPTARVNGIEKTMDVPARLIHNKTMIPLRFVSEGLGYTVDWDENTRIVTVR